jgi:hypothetical protein
MENAFTLTITQRAAIFALLVYLHLYHFDNPSQLLPCVVWDPGIVHAV